MITGSFADRRIGRRLIIVAPFVFVFAIAMLSYGTLCAADTVDLKSGERIEGTITAVTADGVTIQPEQGPVRSFRHEEITRIDTTALDESGYDLGLLKREIRFRPPAGWGRTNEAKDVDPNQKKSYSVTFYLLGQEGAHSSISIIIEDEGYLGTFKQYVKMERDRHPDSEKSMTFSGQPCHVFLLKEPGRARLLKSYLFLKDGKVYQLKATLRGSSLESRLAELEQSINTFSFIE